jgi:hypothetical protein
MGPRICDTTRRYMRQTCDVRHLTVVLEPALREAIAHEARRERRLVSSFIRNLIADAVERHARSGSVASA